MFVAASVLAAMHGGCHVQDEKRVR